MYNITHQRLTFKRYPIFKNHSNMSNELSFFDMLE